MTGVSNCIIKYDSTNDTQVRTNLIRHGLLWLSHAGLKYSAQKPDFSSGNSAVMRHLAHLCRDELSSRWT